MTIRLTNLKFLKQVGVILPWPGEYVFYDTSDPHRPIRYHALALKHPNQAAKIKALPEYRKETRDLERFWLIRQIDCIVYRGNTFFQVTTHVTSI